ncbi:MAG: hypothetical protein M3454_03395 [Actinomycetota bacterium]|nr:hypothetical protein [Actinomycetota bacterium]
MRVGSILQHEAKRYEMNRYGLDRTAFGDARMLDGVGVDRHLMAAPIFGIFVFSR